MSPSYKSSPASSSSCPGLLRVPSLSVLKPLPAMDGQSYYAKLCTYFLLRTLRYTSQLPPRDVGSPDSDPSCTTGLHDLETFVAHVIRRAQPCGSVVFAALIYTQRLAQRGSDWSSDGHKTFLQAVMLAHKYLEDDTYSSDNWSIVSGGLYSRDEINALQRSVYAELDWSFGFDPLNLCLFAAALIKSHATESSCPSIPPIVQDSVSHELQRKQPSFTALSARTSH